MLPTITVRRDGGWAWLVLIGGFFHLFIAALPFAIGQYVQELIRELNVNHTTAGLFGALQLATLYLGGPATFLSEMYSHRTVIFSSGIIASIAIVASIHISNINVLFLTFATLPGLCIGTAYVQSVIVVNRYFDKYAGLSNGVIFSGCGLGSIVVPFIYDAIIERYGWRSSLYIVAGMTLHICVFAMLLRPINLPVFDEFNTKSQEILSSKKSRKELFVNPRFYLFLLCNILWSASMGSVFVLGPNLFYERGLTNEQISMLLALIGFGNFVIRIIIGFLLHLREWNLVAVHTTITVIMAAAIALFVVFDTFITFAIASIMFGLSYGATTVTQAIVPRVFAGMHNYGTAYSFVVGVCCAGITGGPPLTGYIFDKTKSYETAFLVNSGMALAAALILSISFVMNACHHKVHTDQTLVVHTPDQTLVLTQPSPDTDESSISRSEDQERLMA